MRSAVLNRAQIGNESGSNFNGSWDRNEVNYGLYKNPQSKFLEWLDKARL
jgi:hypothetical protein